MPPATAPEPDSDAGAELDGQSNGESDMDADEDGDIESGPAELPTPASAEDAAHAACAHIDSMPSGAGTDVELLRKQQHALTVAGEYLRVAADADVEYLYAAEAASRMAQRATDAIALVEEHGDHGSWEAEVNEAWGEYAFGQVDDSLVISRFCYELDPPDRSPFSLSAAPHQQSFPIRLVIAGNALAFLAWVAHRELAGGNVRGGVAYTPRTTSIAETPSRLA